MARYDPAPPYDNRAVDQLIRAARRALHLYALGIRSQLALTDKGREAADAEANKILAALRTALARLERGDG